MFPTQNTAAFYCQFCIILSIQILKMGDNKEHPHIAIPEIQTKVYSEPNTYNTALIQ